MPGYPVTPILAIAACLYLIVGLGWSTYLWFAVWVLAVLAFYLLWGRRHSLLARQPEGADAAAGGPAEGPAGGGS